MRGLIERRGEVKAIVALNNDYEYDVNRASEFMYLERSLLNEQLSLQ
ncbi:hypothetical protein VAE122_910002 [Vibrio aestuarianus]|nr:hypothetical protein VAE122_910002 [Vibrio aestuarianus]